MEALLIFLVIWVIMICIGMYVADQKGRSSGEGCLFTILLGPLGILIVALLPTIKRAAPSSPAASSSTPLSQADTDEAIRRYAERQRLRAVAEREAFQEQIEASKQAAMKRRIEKREAYLARGITPGPLAWLESFSLDLTNWYKGSSDLMQMLVWTVCLSIPAAALAVFLFRPR